MAEIFLAMTESIEGFEKLVVIKRILPQFAGDPSFRRMFLDEARLAATLDHPNIVNVHDIGELDGSYFFTMEYVHGQSLGRVMRMAAALSQPVPLEHTLAAITGTCSGLHHAHEKIGLDGIPLGIVHRDVSPPNILITYDGGVKLVDFGIAKANTLSDFTAVGTLKGKIPYMSPEQCRAERLDRRSDIFALGVVLYELTVGRRPFHAEHEIGLLNMIATQQPPMPTSIVPGYPPQLERIVMRAIASNPDDRYPTARHFQIDVEDFAREFRVPVSSAKMALYMERMFDDEARRWPTNPAIIARDERGTGSYGMGDGDVDRTQAGDPPATGLDAIDSVLSRIVSTDAALVVENLTNGLGHDDEPGRGGPGTA